MSERVSLPTMYRNTASTHNTSRPTTSSICTTWSWRGHGQGTPSIHKTIHAPRFTRHVRRRSHRFPLIHLLTLIQTQPCSISVKLFLRNYPKLKGKKPLIRPCVDNRCETEPWKPMYRGTNLYRQTGCVRTRRSCVCPREPSKVQK